MNTHSFVATSAAVLLGFAAVLSLSLSAVQNAGAGSQKVKSPCDKEGPFSPKVDKDLLRKDLAIEPGEMPGISEKRPRSPRKRRMRSAARVGWANRQDDHFARPATRLRKANISRRR